MKNLLLILFLPLAFVGRTYSQSLNIDSTRFITGNKCCVILNYAIPTSDGGIFFVGWDGNNPGGIIPYFPDTGGRANVLVGKMDNNKQISWIKVFGGTDEDFGISACQTPDGGYAVLSHVSSSDIDIIDHKGGVDMWLLRLDAIGNVLWKKSYGSSLSEQSISIANTTDGGFILFGNSNGNDGDVPFHYGSFFKFDWLVIKVDGAGNVQWSKDLGTTGDELEQGAILAVDDVYYLIGASEGKGNDCTDTFWHIGVNTIYDYYVLKIDAAGNVLWNRSYGGSKSDIPVHAFYDTRDSTIMINGISYSSDYIVAANYGQQDMWVLKVNKNGSLIWQKSFGSVNPEEGTGICQANNGGYVVYGSTRLAIGGDDLWLFITDVSGNEITNTVFGGIDSDKPRTVVPFQNSYAISGISMSTTFTEGQTYGKNAPSQNAFVSFVDYWPTSVDDIPTNAGKVVLYPNPAANRVTVRLPENTVKGNISVKNAMGLTVYNVPYFPKENIELNISNWPEGLYFVQCIGNDGICNNARLLKN